MEPLKTDNGKELSIGYFDQVMAAHPHVPPAELMKEIMHWVDFYKDQIGDHMQQSREQRLEVVRAAHEATDQLITERMHMPNAQKITCKKGCAFCCHIQVYVSLAEAEYILDYAKKNNITFDLERLKEQAKIQGTTEYARSPHNRCVFLADDKTCKIYPARPGSCRRYHVVSDPQLCDASKYKQGVLVAQVLQADFLGGALMVSDTDAGSMPEMILKANKRTNY